MYNAIILILTARYIYFLSKHYFLVKIYQNLLIGITNKSESTIFIILTKLYS